MSQKKGSLLHPATFQTRSGISATTGCWIGFMQNSQCCPNEHGFVAFGSTTSTSTEAKLIFLMDFSLGLTIFTDEWFINSNVSVLTPL